MTACGLSGYTASLEYGYIYSSTVILEYRIRYLKVCEVKSVLEKRWLADKLEIAIIVPPLSSVACNCTFSLNCFNLVVHSPHSNNSLDAATRESALPLGEG